MALPFSFNHPSRLWNSPDPNQVMGTPASSFVRDVNAVARTRVDWKETDTAHIFKVDLPGLRKEDVQVQIEDWRTLSISGQPKREDFKGTDIWHRVERISGRFMRQFRLPENANLDLVTANVDSGVLTVVVPKVEKTFEPRTIEIGGSEQPAAIAHNGTE